MSRLTEKNKFDTHYSISISKNLLQSAYDKLGKLEDLEEQLGCPLEVVVKAINKGIFSEDLPSGKIVMWHGLRLSRVETEWYLSNEKICVGLKDYKKTWWLKEDRSE